MKQGRIVSVEKTRVPDICKVAGNREKVPARMFHHYTLIHE